MCGTTRQRLWRSHKMSDSSPKNMKITLGLMISTNITCVKSTTNVASSGQVYRFLYRCYGGRDSSAPVPKCPKDQGRSHYEARRGNCLVLFSCSTIRLTSIVSKWSYSTGWQLMTLIATVVKVLACHYCLGPISDQSLQRHEFVAGWHWQKFGPELLYCLKCTKFGQLILRKINK